MLLQSFDMYSVSTNVPYLFYFCILFVLADRYLNQSNVIYVYRGANVIFVNHVIH